MWSGVADSARSVKLRSLALQITSSGTFLVSAIILWKLLICFTGSESPIVVVLTGSMEPAFRRGDVLFLQMKGSPIRAGEIVVFKIKGKDIPIVHRVIKVHQQQGTRQVKFLTKGDNNPVDDSQGIYADGQLWLNHHDVVGRVTGYVPHIGWATIILTEKTIVKYLLFGALSLLLVTSN